MSADISSVQQWLADQKDAMIGLLEEVVNVDSGSYDKAGVDSSGHGIATTVHPRETYGDAITAAVSGSGGSNKPIILMGHRDTVFPNGETARRPFRIENGRGYGPGVADMKAGLTMNCFILAAFAVVVGMIVGAADHVDAEPFEVLEAGLRLQPVDVGRLDELQLPAAPHEESRRVRRRLALRTS